MAEMHIQYSFYWFLLVQLQCISVVYLDVQILIFSYIPTMSWNWKCSMSHAYRLRERVHQMLTSGVLRTGIALIPRTYIRKSNLYDCITDFRQKAIGAV